MTRTTCPAHRFGLAARAVSARAGTAAPSMHARTERSPEPSRPAVLSSSRQAGLDRTTQLARLHPLPARTSQEGVPAALAITGTGEETPAFAGGVLPLHALADRHLVRSWDRANLTGARA